ncbi:MAG: RNA methyltransferase [Clostridia bacterium]|nr:RNA methyltransferase [Clostridia bacterium]MBQ2110652.1 RNA methyltransferase [Clostridia bacterium]MBQ3938352.1 RNA methyltransferase [Clostridia bacterium]MBQ5487908.1 RNA methyltransferase [Clostridia bacterium]MBR4635100.1 RNA methyltransferase [Clostridia bacterium]
MLITSRNNDTVRLMRSLTSRKARQETGLHLIEGERLVFDALRAGAKAEHLLIEEGEWELEAKASSLAVPFVSVTRSVMLSVSDTKTPQGVAAAVRTPDLTPPAVYPAGLAVALDRMQDPGNLGTVLRTADAMGAGCILLGTGSTDPFSPKALRSAMGSTYHMPVYEGELTTELRKLKAEGRTLLCGHLKGEEKLPDIGENCVIVIGNEGSGVSEEVASLCTLYRLKMYGRAESLNASIAASLMIYEVTKKLHE